MRPSSLHLLLLLLAMVGMAQCKTQVEEGSSCPELFIEIKGTCYFISSDLDLRATWDDALASCQDFGKDYNLQIGLAELGTANPSTPDVELMQTISDKGYDSVWLGASDIQHEGEWLWQDSRQTLYLSNSMWAFGQPSGQSLQNCLEAGYWTEEHNRPYLNDAPCDEASNYYICQVFE